MMGSMSEHDMCIECGSESLVATGVFEHGTWIHRLTCWTCNDCGAVVAVPEAEIEEGDLSRADAPTAV